MSNQGEINDIECDVVEVSPTSMDNRKKLSFPIPEKGLEDIYDLKKTARGPVRKWVKISNMGFLLSAVLCLLICVGGVVLGFMDGVTLGTRLESAGKGLLFSVLVCVVLLVTAHWFFHGCIPWVLRKLYPSSFEKTKGEVSFGNLADVIRADLLRNIADAMQTHPDKLLEIPSAYRSASPGFLAFMKATDKIAYVTPPELFDKHYSVNMTLVPCRNIIFSSTTLDSATITSGGLKEAAIGGVLLGGAGMVAGAVVGKKTSKNEVKSAILHLAYKDNETDATEFIEIGLSPPPSNLLWWSNFLVAQAEGNKQRQVL